MRKNVKPINIKKLKKYILKNDDETGTRNSKRTTRTNES